jgi:hypothetical protein
MYYSSNRLVDIGFVGRQKARAAGTQEGQRRIGEFIFFGTNPLNPFRITKSFPESPETNPFYSTQPSSHASPGYAVRPLVAAARRRGLFDSRAVDKKEESE